MASGASPIVVLAPDKFKGALTAPEVCDAMARGLERVWPDVSVRACPMADGGDGTLDAVLARGGARAVHTVTGAGGRPRAAPYGILDAPEGRTAVLEVAQIVGLTDPDGIAAPVAQRTTRGVGELIRALLDDGVRRFMVGLGGSSTNDGGAGMLCGLGLRVLDQRGADVAPTPAGLAALARVDAGTLDPRLAKAAITIMSDVNNPLCGRQGATAVFGPQKGVASDEVAAVDETLARFASLAEAALHRSAATKPGAGAAGGLGFALQLLGGLFWSGAEVVAALVSLDAALGGADWAITGEGRSDAQTLLAKAPAVVAAHARAARVPVTLLSGAVDAQALPQLSAEFAGCFALPCGPLTLAESIAAAPALIADRAEQMARLFAAARGIRSTST